jgi:hypothetical protein
MSEITGAERDLWNEAQPQYQEIKEHTYGRIFLCTASQAPAPAGQTSLAQVRKPWENCAAATRAP